MQAVEIPCCLCGTMILPNAANQCATCLAQEIDLKSRLQRGPGGSQEIYIHQCRQCRRFERKERLYATVELESPELMAICLKHIPALLPNASPKLAIVDAIWIFTEPNCMRFKVRLTVRTEIHNVAIQQRSVVEFHVRWKQCPECNREFTNRTWHALVQLRQRRSDEAPRKGLTMLEMALARNAQVRQHVLSMDTSKQGFDFYFLTLPEAQSFASYLARVAPMRIKTSNKLVSTDVKSNTANVKYTVACDMVPLCRDDLVLVHKAAKGTHLTGRLCLVTKVSSVVHLVDAFPKRIMAGEGIVGELSPETYYKSGADKHYKVWSSSRRMTKFVVLDIEMCDSAGGLEPNHMVKYALADVQLARESDFGVNDETFHCVTHLGNLLQVGDTVLGYDMSSAVMSGGAEWNVDTCFNHSFVMPDVVLVKKVQGVEKEQQFENKIEKVKLGRAKKRERRRNREEKKMRELEEAAERMGFLEHINEEQFEHQLASDPDLAEDLLAAERELANIAYYSPDEEVIPQDVPGVPDQELVPENVSDKPEDEQGNDQDTSAGI